MLANLLAVEELAATSWSVLITPPAGPAIGHRPDALLRTASVGKLFLLARTAELIDAGELDPAEPLARTSVEPIADSGLWQHLTTETLPVADLATLIGTVSDNWATNVLLQRVGLESVQELARRWCPGGSQLWDRVRDQRHPTDPPTLSSGCAADLTRLLRAAQAGSLINDRVSRRLLDWLAPSVDLSMVASAFALDPLAHVPSELPLAVWNKTGTDDGVRADVGLLSGPAGSLTYAVVCNFSDPSALGAVMATMRELGELAVRTVSTTPKTGTIPDSV